MTEEVDVNKLKAKIVKHQGKIKEIKAIPAFSDTEEGMRQISNHLDSVIKMRTQLIKMEG